MNDDAGAAGLTVVLGTVLVLTVAVAAVTAVADLALTSARARTAADAAALAAVGASPLARGAMAPGVAGAGADPDAQARRLAAANDATVVDVEPLGWPLRYGVTVAVEPATPWVARLVGPVHAGAVAALRPRAGGPPRPR